MIGGLWNGLSGLNTFEKALNVESNNATNVNTVAYKSDDIKFEDLMYQQGYGKGSTVQTVDKNILQGSLKVTNNSYDVAIDGTGYFITKDENNDISYTRAGNFQMDSEGLLQMPSGQKILGLTPQETTIVSSDINQQVFTNNYNNFIASQAVTYYDNDDIEPNNSFTKSINAKATNYLQSATASGISGNGYKSADSKISDIDVLISDYKSKLNTYALSPNDETITSTTQISSIDYSNLTANLLDENDSINVLINNSKITQQFDTNIETTLNNFSDKISNVKGLTSSVDTTTGILKITSLIPGEEVSLTEASINDNYSAITTIQDATLGSGQGLVDSSRTALKTALEAADAKLIDFVKLLFGSMSSLS